MICWFESSSSDVGRNEHSVFILSSISSSKSGLGIHTNNFRHFVALSISKGREVIGRSNWIQKDNLYLAPKDKIK